MARPRKDGLDYFSFDTSFFSDKKIKILKARYGNDGVMTYIYLLSEIYRNGYFAHWDEDYKFLLAQELNLKDGFIEQVLKFLLERSLLDSTLFESDTILTSPGIQKRYQEAVKSRALKTNIEVDKYWLLSSEETATYIKVTQKGIYSENNNSFSKNNMSLSEEEPHKVKESKEKKSKGKNNKECDSPASPAFNAEKAWEDTFHLYPKKSQAVMAKTTWMDKILQVIEGNRKALAVLIYKSTRMYLADYESRNPDDESFRYVPKYSDWLMNDCDYWIVEVEKMQKGDGD